MHLSDVIAVGGAGDKPSEEGFNVPKQPFLRYPQHPLAAKAAGQGSREPWWG